MDTPTPPTLRNPFDEYTDVIEHRGYLIFLFNSKPILVQAPPAVTFNSDVTRFAVNVRSWAGDEVGPILRKLGMFMG